MNEEHYQALVDLQKAADRIFGLGMQYASVDAREALEESTDSVGTETYLVIKIKPFSVTCVLQNSEREAAGHEPMPLFHTGFTLRPYN